MKWGSRSQKDLSYQRIMFLLTPTDLEYYIQPQTDIINGIPSICSTNGLDNLHIFVASIPQAFLIFSVYTHSYIHYSRSRARKGREELKL